MQKLESSLKNMVLVLVGVALVVGAVLAYINHLTSGPIAEKAAQSLATGIKSVMGTEEDRKSTRLENQTQMRNAIAVC